MSIAEEIRKLAELRDQGTLTKEEFETAKARLLGSGDGQPAAGSTQAGAAAPAPLLRRARQDRWIGGVCGGLGHYTGVESWTWRVLFTAAVLFAGIGLLPYIVLWIFVPTDDRL
jgi:phage shock protein PspC (stress-responsive transcriptional regulator)